MFKINLVPESKKQRRKIQKMNLMVTIGSVSIIGILLITILVLAGVKISKNSSSNKLSKSIEKTEKELKKYDSLEKTVVSLQNGLKGIEEIEKNSSKWSKFFSELEKATPKDVSFERLDIIENEIRADLRGKDIDSLARFVDSFKNYKFNSVSGDIEKLKGDYTGSQTYKTGDIVTYGGSQFVALKETTENIPSNTAFWEEEGEPIFTNVDVSGYTKDEGGEVKFSVKMNLKKEVLWK